MRRTVLLIGLMGAGLHAAAAPGQDPDTDPGPFNPRVLMKPVRPIVDAPVLPASEVTDEVRDNELVIGVTVDGAARAYPVNMLTGPIREIINDQLGGRSIAATW